MTRYLAAVVCVAAAGLAGCANGPSGPDDDNQPSGTIVFVSDREGDDEIYSVHADGGHLQKLTANSDDDLYPDISADGTKVASSIWDGDDEESGRWTPTGAASSG
jgi:Tol biopolymer transport system component